jgi:hypothetical protein
LSVLSLLHYQLSTIHRQLSCAEYRSRTDDLPDYTGTLFPFNPFNIK